MIKLHDWRAYVMSALGGLIMSFGFTQWHIGWVVLVGLIPFLLVEDYVYQNRNTISSSGFFLRLFVGMFVWNTISVFWVWFSTPIAGVITVFWNSIAMSLPFLLYHKVRLRLPKKESYVALVVFWLSFEFIYLRVIMAFPWLLLGNAFANNVRWIQWYEFTGAAGGTLWVLILNLLLFELYKTYTQSKTNIKRQRNLIMVTLVMFLVPLTASHIRYFTYKEKGADYDVLVLQPNVDPYQKFHISKEEQLIDMLELTDSLMDDDVDYVVFPETAIPLYLNADSVFFEEHPVIRLMRKYINANPNAHLIVGLTSRDFYFSEEERSETSHPYDNFWFDEYNVSYQLDTTGLQQKYYKSKLVPGVETLPWVEDIKFLNDLIINLGGSRNSLTPQKHRSVFRHSQDSVSVGTPICYESIYGEFVSGFVRKGANFLFIMTNDGWWRDTPGYKQHAMFARIRAIENRRSVGRSANTGISMLINQRGDVLQSRGWWKRDAIRGKLKSNDELTFYSKYGDYFGRIALFLSVMILLHLISYTLLKKKEQ